MEAPNTNSGSFQITLPNPGRLLSIAWAIIALLMAVCYLIPNYKIATINLNGIDVIRMGFNDQTLHRIWDDSSYVLMVGVPMAYLGLAILLGIAALLRIRGKAKQLPLVGTVFSLIVLVLSVLGLFLIGGDASDVPFLGKLMPRPVIGYHFSMILQGFAAALGLFYLMGQRRGTAPTPASTME